MTVCFHYLPQVAAVVCWAIAVTFAVYAYRNTEYMGADEVLKTVRLFLYSAAFVALAIFAWGL